MYICIYVNCYSRRMYSIVVSLNKNHEANNNNIITSNLFCFLLMLLLLLRKQNKTFSLLLLLLLFKFIECLFVCMNKNSNIFDINLKRKDLKFCFLFI